jgi:hypothetical protein
MSAQGAIKRARRLQGRICSMDCPLPPAAEKLFEQLKRGLLGAYRSEHLQTSPHEIQRLLRLEKSRHHEVWEIMGGNKDFGRASRDEQFERHDGALFNFAVTVARRPDRQALDLLAYNFELRFAPGAHIPRFIRFDLNWPEHENNQTGMRCHLHPGHDDLQAPSALLAPVDLLELFLYRLDLPDKQRLQ